MTWKKFSEEKPPIGKRVFYLDINIYNEICPWFGSYEVSSDGTQYWYLEEIRLKNECNESDWWIEIPKIGKNNE